VRPLSCAACGTEVSSDLLACPACGALAHADRLKRLAADAQAARDAGDLEQARAHWQDARRWLPKGSQQFAIVDQRIRDLTTQLEPLEAKAGGSVWSSGDGQQSWWRRGAGAAAAMTLLLLGKLKFLLLGLTKLGTLLSMFAFVGVYWSIYGWPLAVGIVTTIYIHEMGHVAMLRRLGIDAGAPTFIPGVGALILLKQNISDPLTDAKIGLAGPVWGLGAALTALAIYGVTRAPIWLALAQLTGFVNLFNLIPIWQLDGSRGMHVLARWQRWTLVALVGVTFLFTGTGMLALIGAVAIWRALQTDSGPGDVGVLATFLVLIVTLAVLAKDLR
jgi:Zn-dependent protease